MEVRGTHPPSIRAGGLGRSSNNTLRDSMVESQQPIQWQPGQGCVHAPSGERNSHHATAQGAAAPCPDCCSGGRPQDSTFLTIRSARRSSSNNQLHGAPPSPPQLLIPRQQLPHHAPHPSAHGSSGTAPPRHSHQGGPPPGSPDSLVHTSHTGDAPHSALWQGEQQQPQLQQQGWRPAQQQQHPVGLPPAPRALPPSHSHSGSSTASHGAAASVQPSASWGSSTGSSSAGSSNSMWPGGASSCGEGGSAATSGRWSGGPPLAAAADVQVARTVACATAAAVGAAAALQQAAALRPPSSAPPALSPRPGSSSSALSPSLASSLSWSARGLAAPPMSLSQPGCEAEVPVASGGVLGSCGARGPSNPALGRQPSLRSGAGVLNPGAGCSGDGGWPADGLPGCNSSTLGEPRGGSSSGSAPWSSNAHGDCHSAVASASGLTAAGCALAEAPGELQLQPGPQPHPGAGHTKGDPGAPKPADADSGQGRSPRRGKQGSKQAGKQGGKQGGKRTGAGGAAGKAAGYSPGTPRRDNAAAHSPGRKASARLAGHPGISVVEAGGGGGARSLPRPGAVRGRQPSAGPGTDAAGVQLLQSVPLSPPLPSLSASQRSRVPALDLAGAAAGNACCHGGGGGSQRQLQGGGVAAAGEDAPWRHRAAALQPSLRDAALRSLTHSPAVSQRGAAHWAGASCHGGCAGGPTNTPAGADVGLCGAGGSRSAGATADGGAELAPLPAALGGGPLATWRRTPSGPQVLPSGDAASPGPTGGSCVPTKHPLEPLLPHLSQLHSPSQPHHQPDHPSAPPPATPLPRPAHLDPLPPHPTSPLGPQLPDGLTEPSQCPGGMHAPPDHTPQALHAAQHQLCSPAAVGAPSRVVALLRHQGPGQGPEAAGAGGGAAAQLLAGRCGTARIPGSQAAAAGAAAAATASGWGCLTGGGISGAALAPGRRAASSRHASPARTSLFRTQQLQPPASPPLVHSPLRATGHPHRADGHGGGAGATEGEGEARPHPHHAHQPPHLHHPSHLPHHPQQHTAYDPAEEVRKAQERLGAYSRAQKERVRAAEAEEAARRHKAAEERSRQAAAKERRRVEIYALNAVLARSEAARTRLLLEAMAAAEEQQQQQEGEEGATNEAGQGADGAAAAACAEGPHGVGPKPAPGPGPGAGDDGSQGDSADESDDAGIEGPDSGSDEDSDGVDGADGGAGGGARAAVRPAGAGGGSHAAAAALALMQHHGV